MSYELWDRSSGNRLGEFPTPVDAFQLVCEIADTDGPAAVKALVLGFEDDKGHSMPLAEGEQLLKYARQARLATAG